MISEETLYLKHTNERLGELLDEVAALLFWTLDHAKKNRIQLNNSFGFHITRIQSILNEIGHPPSPRMGISDDWYHPKASDDKEPESP